MKGLCELDPLLDLVYVVNGLSCDLLWFLLTSAEKVRKHVERIGVVSLTALVSLQTFLRRIVNTCTSK